MEGTAPTPSPLRRPSPAVVLPALAMLAYAWLQMYTLPDYGIMWDAWEYHVGDKALRFYLTLDPGSFDFLADDLRLYDDPAHPDFHTVAATIGDLDVVKAPWLIWPVGPVVSSVTKWVSFRWLGLFGVYEAHHLSLVGWMALLLWGVYRFARRHFGVAGAITALLLLAAHPRLWAHAHNNLKDLPLAVLFSWVIFTLHESLSLTAAPSPGTADDQAGGGDANNPGAHLLILLSAVLWGLALATKANAFFLPFVLVPWFFVARWGKWPGRTAWVAMLAYPFVGVVTMFLAWPYLLLDFPTNLQRYWQSLVERGYGGSEHWNAAPFHFAWGTMPPALLGLLLVGLGVVVAATVRRRRLEPLHLLLVLWLLVPVLRVCLPGAKDFDGIRHWLELLPAAALIAGLGGQAIVNAIAARLHADRDTWRVLLAVTAALLVLLAPTLAWSVRHHPRQVCYFNSLMGGLPGARARGLPQATDYWCNSYREALAWFDREAPTASVLTVGVAEHLLYYTREVWLRGDLEFLPIGASQPDDLRRRLATRDVYLMYAVREEWYSPLTRYYDACLTPVHTIDVDGEPILKILKLEALPTEPLE